MRLLNLVLFSLILISELKAENDYIIYDASRSEKISLNALSEQIKEFDVIFFGEFHDDSLNHAVQAEYLKSVLESGVKTAVSLEMFERDVQSTLNSYIKDEINEEEFLKKSRPWPDYSKFYKPLVELAKEYESDVIAANIPRKYAAMYVNGGMNAYKSLSDEEKSNIAQTMVLTEDSYLDKFLETMTGSKDAVKSLDANQENTLYLYYGAQCIKDETMAESILKYHKSHPDTKIIHFNGDFHSNSFLGTAAMLSRRDDELKIAVITPIYYSSPDSIDFSQDYSDQGSYILFLPEFKRDKMQRMMGGASHFGENFVVSHDINIEINPSKSFIKGSDKLRFKNPILKSSSVKLLNTLEITSMKSGDNNLKFSVKPADDYYNEIIIENLSLKNQSYDNGGIVESFEAVIEYEGIVNFPPSEINMVKRHSNTLGIISDKEDSGIYLPGGSFYPQAGKDLAEFNIYVTLPKEYKLVTSGTIIENIGTGNVIYQVKSEGNYDDVTLVAAKFKVIEKYHDSVRFAMYYYNESPHNMRYLEESIRYYDLYTDLFGKYPYKSFIIAENFFPTGFAMPGYTLLSNRLTAMPWVTLSPGSLAHEFVHNWWGNSVFVDYTVGNWCEALTTFSTNYYYNILNTNKAAELDWRRKALISIDALPDDMNYPVSDFKYQKTTYDAAIGYSKGAFILDIIRKMIGDDRFFNALKSFAENNNGKRAYWMHLTGEFTKAAKDTLNDINWRNVINEWLRTKDIPVIKYADLPTFTDDSLTLKVESDIKRTMKLPIKISYADNSNEMFHYLMQDSVCTITLPKKGDIEKIELDPELECLRKLYPWEKPFNLERTLSAKPVIVLPDKMSPEFKIAMDYVNAMKESGFNFDYYTHDNLSDFDKQHSSLILLGNIKSNSIIADYAKQFPVNIKLNETGMTFDGKQTEFIDDVMMASVEHLNKPQEFCTIMYFNHLPDASALNRFSHYRTYSLVLLNSKRPGRPVFDMEIYPAKVDNSSMIWQLR